ncbi:MAG: transposase [Bacteroidota bacterium]
MTFRPRHVPDHLYFVTATIVGWKRLFLRDQFQEIVLGSLKWLREKNRMELYAFVLMPHHLHFICRPRNGYTISQVLQAFGSFTAHKFLNALRVNKEEKLLAYFRRCAQKKRSKEHHQFWQQIQARNVFTERVLYQKLEYLHDNPVAKGWQFIDNRWEYRLSSACFYDNGIDPIIPIDDAGPLLM